MIMNKLILILFFVSTLNLLNAETSNDTIRVYQLGDISVTGKAPASLFSKSNIESVDYETIQNSDVQSFSELQTYIPSARIKSNSRGESLIYLRGAGERQIGLFFDGVPLNIAWDNRFDLSLLPVNIIAKININKTGNSILYGPNILGGAVNISTFERATEGFGGNLHFQGGEAGMYQAAVSQDGKIGKLNYLASLSYLKTDGFLLSQNAPDTLMNQYNNSSIRTNTDREFLSLYARAEYQFNTTDKLGISILNINGDKGVAPETDIDSNHSRFWRYPDWNRTLTALNGQIKLNEDASWIFKGTAWYDIFGQDINSYKNISYTDMESEQNDNDNSTGTRLSLLWNMDESNTFSYVLNWSYSRHKETVTENITGPNDIKIDINEYSQNLLSTGLDYQYLNKSFSIRTGILFDYFATGKAGPYVNAEGSNISDYGFYINPVINLSDNLHLFVNITRRTRFPTLRESYSGALGKFIVNPDLKPETGYLNEIGFNYSAEKWAAEIAGFANLYSDMISKIRLTADEDSLRRYMRINYSEINIFGVDASFALFPIENLSLKANLTYMNSKHALKSISGSNLPIENKPEILAGFVATYSFDFGLVLQAEAQTVGKQYQRNPENKKEYLSIEGTTIFNARLGYRLPQFFNTNVEFYLRVNNIADTYRIYQLGLPEPGRMMRAGLMLNF